ncbi:MAG TPA: hypothetical protein PLO67_08840 [Saprospiraceae bacterium]|nr:hypothetical protein [Saprospiraceae bacterium]HPI04845.1 hypothetical protein [Saprospiraceae bacterium]
MPNDLSVVVSDIPDGRLLLIPSQGEITRRDSMEGEYIWTICEKISGTAMLVLADSVEEQPVDTLRFRVKVPEPEFMLAPKYGSSSRSPIGIVGFWNAYQDAPDVEIVGYDVLVMPPDQDPVEIHNTGIRFNSDIMHQITRAAPGYAYDFYNIAWKIGCDPKVRLSSREWRIEIKVK